MLSSSLDLIRTALAEDIGTGDITSAAFIPEGMRSTGRIVTRQSVTVAGLSTVLAIFQELDPQVTVKLCSEDGGVLNAGETLLELEGPTRSLLSGERVALNFLGRLTGIATHTRLHVDAVRGTGVSILDTRKMTPGWRLLEKEAVRAGGGKNHRVGLFDAVLIKDNHLAALGVDAMKTLPTRLAAIRSYHPQIKIEIEADTLQQVELFLGIKEINTILLDNMTLQEMRDAVLLRNEREASMKLEASGGISLENLRTVAETGVDEISLGALTHSVFWADLSMEIF